MNRFLRFVALLIVAATPVLLMGAARWYDSAQFRIFTYLDDTTIAGGEVLVAASKEPSDGSSLVGARNLQSFRRVPWPTRQINFSITDDADGVFTSNPDMGTLTTPTNSVTIRAALMDKDTIENLYYHTKVPDYVNDTGNATLTFHWFEATAEADTKVSWGARIISVGSGTTLDDATAGVTVSSSSQNSAVLLNQAHLVQSMSTWGFVGGEMAILDIYRSATDSTDDYGYDAQLIGITLEMPINPLVAAE